MGHRFVRRSDRHVKFKILKAGGLRNLPVDCGGNVRVTAVVGGIKRHLGKVKDHVSDLAKELILAYIPALATTASDIGVCIDESNPAKSITSDDHRFVEWMSNELSEVPLYDGPTDSVTAGLVRQSYQPLWKATDRLFGTHGKIDNGAVGERAITVRTATPAVLHSGVDGLGGIGLSGGVSAIVEDASVDFVDTGIASQGLLPLQYQRPSCVVMECDMRQKLPVLMEQGPAASNMEQCRQVVSASGAPRLCCGALPCNPQRNRFAARRHHCVCLSLTY